MKILTIVGARPQFIKAAMVSRAIAAHNLAGKTPAIVEDILHTGQHYDENMSDVFFKEMGIPEPVVNLNVGSGLHGAMTARMLEGIEREIVARQPDWVLVFGDTNSTLAGALAATKLHVPVAHVEAGLRSFNRRMPEEVNRVLTDHIADLLFCPTTTAVAHLRAEGITCGVHHVGDVMYDAALAFGEIAARKSSVLRDLDLTSKRYFLATVHRAENTDVSDRLTGILAGFARIADPDCPVVFPVHPRTRRLLDAAMATLPVETSRRLAFLKRIRPVSFLDMVMLEKHARLILTDSGGVQKEAYFNGVPCVTLRDETEWVETVAAGWNRVVGADSETIAAAVRAGRPGRPIREYGDGHSSESLLNVLLTNRICKEGAHE